MYWQHVDACTDPRYRLRAHHSQALTRSFKHGSTSVFTRFDGRHPGVSRAEPQHAYPLGSKRHQLPIEHLEHTHACMHTHVHTYMHTQIQYIHTHIHTHIHDTCAHSKGPGLGFVSMAICHNLRQKTSRATPITRACTIQKGWR